MITEHAMECFIKKADKYLILHRAKHKKIMPGVAMAPGGRVEVNENLYQATIREISEETGLTIKNIKLKAIGNIINYELDTRLIITLLTADYESGQNQEHIDKEGEFIWLKQNEIESLPNLLAELHKVLPHVLADTNQIISYYAEYSQGNTMTVFKSQLI